MRFAFVQEITELRPIKRWSFNSGFMEGWAAYAEGVAEDLGVLHEPSAPIEHRLLLGRGLVTGVGVNVFGWTDKQAVD